ncbi:hypothetical protein ACS0TY_013238 [Phlomoides rotata]
MDNSSMKLDVIEMGKFFIDYKLFLSYENTIILDVLLMTLFGVIAQMIKEINTFVVLMSYGFLKLHRKSKRLRLVDRIYSILTKVLGQIEKLNFLVGYHNETCKDHIRMNTDCFNCLCYLLRNLGGLRDTRYTISKHSNLVLNTLLKLYNVLFVTPKPVPKDSNDYRWKYFKWCLGALDGTYIPIRVPHLDIPHYRNPKVNVSVNVLDEWDDSRQPQNHHKYFNLKHTRAQNMIERSFGILKARWEILRSNSYYPIKTQNHFILGCFLLHNFNRTHMFVDSYEDEVPELGDDGNDGADPVDGFIDQVESSPEWTIMRDNLAMQMFADYKGGMEGNFGALRGGQGRKRAESTTHRV